MWNTATATTATPAPLPAITSTTNHHIITLPHFSHTHPFRNIDIHISFITTIDALFSKFLGSNARPNLDIFAQNISQSFCAPYTLQPFDTLALFNGLYFHNLSNMGEAVALAAYKAFAIFITPILPDTPPLIQYNKNKPPIHWFNYLKPVQILIAQIRCKVCIEFAYVRTISQRRCKYMYYEIDANRCTMSTQI